jgi:hypothetical protein
VNTWGPEDHVDLGSGHSFTWVVGDPARFPTDDARLLRWHGEAETLVGIIHWHPRADGKTLPDGSEAGCGGGVMFVRSTSPSEAERPIWQVMSLDPLHIEPSVLCTPGKGGCGSHGWIRGGLWVPA